MLKSNLYNKTVSLVIPVYPLKVFLGEEHYTLYYN